MFDAEAEAAKAIEKNPSKYAHYLVEEAGGLIEAEGPQARRASSTRRPSPTRASASSTPTSGPATGVWCRPARPTRTPSTTAPGSNRGAMGMIVSTKGGPISGHQGSALSAFPDVCKTPGPGGPVPIPYPNIANAAPCRDQAGAPPTSVEAADSAHADRQPPEWQSDPMARAARRIRRPHRRAL